MAKLTERLRKGAQTLLESADDLQERIRERAQAIWEREGRPEGRHEDHWGQAEKEINAEHAADQPRRKARASNPTRTKVPGEVKSAAAEPVTRRRPKKSAPVSDAGSAVELPAKTRSRKTRAQRTAPAEGTERSRRPKA